MTLLLVATVLAADLPVGVAATTSDGRLCVAWPGPALQPRSAVTLVAPDPPQGALAAEIERMASSCDTLERALVPGPYYDARLPAAVPAAGGPWVALAGRVPARPLESGGLVLDLGPDHPRVQVRSCTSTEGLHLTVWGGEPRRSERLWHGYYYLAYDVEPSCEEGDFGDGRQ